MNESITKRSDRSSDQPTDKVSEILRAVRLRRSRTLELVLLHFKSHPDSQYRAVELLRALALEPGALHPVLDKLVTGGILAIHLEGDGPRPAKFKSYSLTERGALFGDRYFADLSRQRTAPKQDLVGQRV